MTSSKSEPHYPDPSLVYNEAWLIKDTIIGGIMLVLGSDLIEHLKYRLMYLQSFSLTQR